MRIWLLALALLLCINIAYAQSPVETLFETLGELNIPESYEEYFLGVDFVLYLLIFGGVLNATASEKFGKPATVGLALALSIAMVVFESNQGFALGDFWYVAVLALVAMVIGLIYSKLHSLKGDHKWTFISIGYVVAYIILTQTVERMDSYILLDNPWLHLLLQILLVAAILKLTWDVIALLSTKEKTE